MKVILYGPSPTINQAVATQVAQSLGISEIVPGWTGDTILKDNALHVYQTSKRNPLEDLQSFRSGDTFNHTDFVSSEIAQRLLEAGSMKPKTTTT